jgi:hypothetical protein
MDSLPPEFYFISTPLVARDLTVAGDYFAAMNSVENHRNLLGEIVREPEAVTAMEREELLALSEQLSQPEVSAEVHLEIADRMRQVLEKTVPKSKRKNAVGSPAAFLRLQGVISI